MYYWYFGNIKRASAKTKTILEDIFLILHEKWNTDEELATKKMMRRFANPEEILEEIMRMPVVLDDAESDSWNLKIREPEKLFDEIRDWESLFKWNIVSFEIDKADTEKIDTLAVFVSKMAVYKFCKFYAPKILDIASSEIDDEAIDSLKYEMYGWEKEFWTIWVNYSPEVNLYKDDGMIGKREKLRGRYKACYQKDSKYRAVCKCIEMAFDDEETVQAVKELQNKYLSNSYCHSDKGRGIKEIQNMRHLLDIMERNIEGRLTTQDKADLQDKAQEWKGDIEKLIHMLTEIKN